MKKLLFAGVAMLAMLGTAQAVTVDSFYVGTIHDTTATGGTNDPFPSDLICFDATNECSIKSNGQTIAYAPLYTGFGDVSSPALWKGEADGSQEYGEWSGGQVTGYTIGETSTGEITVNYTEGDLLAHYLAVKAGTSYSLYEIDISELGGLSDGDLYSIAFTTAQLSLKDYSHVSLYNSYISDPEDPEDPSEVPIPAPIMLLLSALAGLGFMGKYRKTTNITENPVDGARTVTRN